MPPIRSLPTVKPIKTERSHEENQERAYIAASRRSDRSLEARIESARRASEIHKKRTGRALRVTEQDVVNEEMYEEEDEDLPAQYRRLTAHLHTGSLDFNRRFHAYILSQHTSRSALANLDPSVAPNPMQYPMAPYFTNPMLQLSPQSISPTSPMTTSQSYRHIPYPVTSPTTAKLPQHHRSMSMSTSQELKNRQQSIKSPQPHNAQTDEYRRQSVPVQPVPTPIQRSQSVQSRPPISRNSSVTGEAQNEVHPSSMAATPQPLVQPSQAFFPDMTSPGQVDFQGPQPNLGPFSTTMPLESQMFLGTSMDPMTMFMAGRGNFPQSISYTYNPNLDIKPKSSATASIGMEQTLAPEVPQSDANAALNPQFDFSAASLGLGFDDNFGEPIKVPAMTRHNSGQGEVDVNNDWASLLNGSVWEEAAT